MYSSPRMHRECSPWVSVRLTTSTHSSARSLWLKDGGKDLGGPQPYWRQVLSSKEIVTTLQPQRPCLEECGAEEPSHTRYSQHLSERESLHSHA